MILTNTPLAHRTALAVALGLGLALSGPAVADVELSFCEINGVDACAADGAILEPAPVLIFRGYLYDLETGDRPSGTGHFILRNEVTAKNYRVPIQRVEARPEVIGPVLETLASYGDVIEEETYDLVNSGFLARLLAGPLPEGVYRVVSGAIDLANGSRYAFEWGDGIQLPRFAIQQTADTAVVSVVAEDGTRHPLSLNVASSGEMTVTGYPPLREGNYTIEAGGNVGLPAAQAAFIYQRPDVDVTASIPIVQNFPGVELELYLKNPLTGRPMTEGVLNTDISNAAGLEELLGELRQNSIPLAEPAFALNAMPNSRGEYFLRLNKTGTAPVDQELELFVEAPDAPDIRLRLLAWDPTNKILVSSSKATAPRLVEEIDIDAELIDPSEETCSQLRLYETTDRLYHDRNYQCALQWKNLHDGFEDGSRRTAVRGPLRELGANLFSYTPGVIATDYVSKRPQFFPAYLDGGVSIDGTEPEPITLAFTPDEDVATFDTLLGDRFPGENFVVVDDDDFDVGDIEFEGAHRLISAKVTFPDGSEELYTTRRNDGRIGLRLTADTLWEQYPVHVDAWYTLNPEAAPSEIDLNFRGIPQTSLVKLERDDDTLHTLAPVTISGYMGRFYRGDVSFDPSTMGDWKVVIYNESDIPVSAEVPVAEDGSFTVDLGLMPEGTHKLYAQAFLVDSNGDTLPFTGRSKERRYEVHYGGPVAATLKARSPNGEVPHRERINVIFDEYDHRRVAGSMLWEQREGTDGAWTPAMQNGVQVDDDDYSPILEDPTIYQYRVTIANEYSGEEFTTDPFQLHAFLKPQFEIVDPGMVMVGQPVTLSVNALDSLETQYTWSIPSSRDPYENASAAVADTFTFTPTATGIYRVEVHARTVDAPDDRIAVVDDDISLRVVDPLSWRTQIEGPRYMEAGQTYRFTATFRDDGRYASPNYELTGYWSLPDGTQVEGPELDYTPSPGDEAISFYTYVVGHPEKTSVTTETFRVWAYQWPEQWALTLDPKHLDVPAIIHYDLVPTDVDRLSRATNGEQLFYEWIIPPGVEHRPRDEDSGYFVITEDGEYQIGVDISDMRGNLVNVMSNRFTIAPAASVLLTGEIWSEHEDASGNYLYYAPGEYVFKVDITELPRDDSPELRELYVDGEYVGSFYRQISHVIEEPGEVDVTFRVETELGNVGEVTQTYNFIAPPLPTCEFTYSASSSGRYMYIVPQCQVSEGRISRYEWTYDVNGSPADSSRSTLTIRGHDCHDNTYSNVNLAVISDLGGRQEYADIPYHQHCPEQE